MGCEDGDCVRGCHRGFVFERREDGSRYTTRCPEWRPRVAVDTTGLGALRARTFETYHPQTPSQRNALATVRSATTAGTGLVLSGPPGVGKTHLVAAATACAPRGALFRRVADVIDTLRAAEMADDGDRRAALREVMAAPFLALDDLGAERPTPFGLERLCLLLDNRVNEARQTFVTTNYAAKDLAATLSGVAGARLVSRLRAVGAWVMIDGPDGR